MTASSGPQAQPERQRQVNAHFDEAARLWLDLYEADSLEGVVYQERRTLALAWIDDLGLAPGSRVLEVGCGAGLVSVELARRGLRVDAIDPAARMVELARAQVTDAGLDGAVTVALGDVHELEFAAGSFALVLALGVLPFLHSPEQAFREVARVLAEGGHFVVSSDNALRLNMLLDPRYTPPLAPLWSVVRPLVQRARGGRGLPTTIPPVLSGSEGNLRPRQVERLAGGAGLTVTRTATLGFGPFSFLGRSLLADATSVRVHRALQRLGARGAPGLRSTGLQQLVVATKDPARAAAGRPAAGRRRLRRSRPASRLVQDTSVPAVVLKVFDHCGVGAARSLGRLGVPVYAVHGDPRAAAARSRYIRETLPWDVDTEPDAASVERLTSFAERIGGRPLLVATDDRSSAFVAGNAAALRGAFRFPEPPPGLARALADKAALHQLCLEHGIPTPDAVVPRSRRDAEGFAASTAFPVVVKGIDGWLLERRAGVRMAFARSREELLGLYDRMSDPDRRDLLFQEYIPGGPESVWMLDGYFDASSECRVAFTGQKLRQWPPYTGPTSLGICTPNEEVEELTRRFMKRIGYRGILDLGYRYDARDGRYKLLDVNPRLGATFRLFVGEDGLDVLRASYLDLTGQPVPRSAARPGRKWMVETHDLAACVVYRRDGALRARDWPASVRGVREAAWFAPDDPAPFAAMAAGSLAKLARRRSIAGPEAAPPAAMPPP